MTAKINFINIGIIIALLVSGVAFTLHESQNDKAAISEEINQISNTISSAVPVSHVGESMPELQYNSVQNSLSINQGVGLITIVVIAMMTMLIAVSMRGIGCFARC